MNRHKPEETGVIPYEKREDEELMAQYVAGDEVAFRELYGRYRARAYGFFSKRVVEPAAVDELFQLAFFKLHRSRVRYQHERLFSAWFFTICRTVLVDYFRKQGRLPLTVPMDKEKVGEGDLATESVGLPDGLLDLLPTKQKEAIKLRFEKELDFPQIASELQTSQENVRQLISRGIRKLRGIVKGKGQ